MGIVEQHSESIQKSNLAIAVQTERQLDKATDSLKEFDTQTDELVNGPEEDVKRSVSHHEISILSSVA